MKKNNFSSLVWRGETAALPLDQLTAVVDHVSCDL